MPLRFICIEIRENLRCANVFLQFEKSLVEAESFKIEVKSDCLTIWELGNGTVFKLTDHFLLDTRTLTNLAVEKFNASFRLSINDIRKDEGLKQFSSSTKPILSFQIGERGNIICSTCKCQLMATDTLVRTREFPSGAVDSCEFFCHAASDFKELLVPRICDLYYGFDFIVVNAEHLQSSTKLRSGHVYCQRCLQYLGETLFNGKAIKMWADTLKIHREGQDDVYNDVVTKATTSQLIRKVVDDCSDVTDPIHSMNFSKVLINTSSSDRKSKYLMIHILEKDLKVLRNDIPFVHNSQNNNIKEEQLTAYQSFKILYKFLEGLDDDNVEKRLPAILQFWQQDISIQSLKISPTMFVALLEELEENALLIPEFYRFNKDEFKLSYVFYKNGQ